LPTFIPFKGGASAYHPARCCCSDAARSDAHMATQPRMGLLPERRPRSRIVDSDHLDVVWPALMHKARGEVASAKYLVKVDRLSGRAVACRIGPPKLASVPKPRSRVSPRNAFGSAALNPANRLAIACDRTSDSAAPMRIPIVTSFNPWPSTPRRRTRICGRGTRPRTHRGRVASVRSNIRTLENQCPRSQT